MKKKKAQSIETRKSKLRNNPRLRSALANLIKSGAFEALKKGSTKNSLLMAQIRDLFDNNEWKENFVDDYEKLLPGMNSYFEERKKEQGKSYFIPKSPDEMFTKFISEMCSTDELDRPLERKDFITFSKIIKNELNNLDDEESKTPNNDFNSLRPADWDSIYSQMDKLTNEGRSAKEASEIVEKEINGVRKAGTIRNKYKGYL